MAYINICLHAWSWDDILINLDWQHHQLSLVQLCCETSMYFYRINTVDPQDIITTEIVPRMHHMVVLGPIYTNIGHNNNKIVKKI